MGGASTTRPRPGSIGSSSTLPSSASSGSLAPPPRNANENKSTRDEPDLISFSAPSETSSNCELNDYTDSNRNNNNASGGGGGGTSDSHANFLQMVDEMHRLVYRIIFTH